MAVDDYSALEPHKGASISRDDLELLALQSLRTGLEARSRVGLYSRTNIRRLCDIGGRAKTAEGVRTEAQKLD
jgi:hypothetical protein